MRMRLAIILLIACTSLGFSSDTGVWRRMDGGVYESDVQTLLVDPKNASTIYSGTSKALYKSTNGGKSYWVILRPSGKQKGINDIYIPQGWPEIIFAATDAGLYESQNKGKSWDRIYFDSDAQSQKCLSVIVYDNTVYLGTQKGLFSKANDEASWYKIKEGLDNKPVYQIVQDDHFLYLAADRMVFNLDKQTKKIQKIFSLGVGDGNGENGILNQALTNREDQSIKFIQTVFTSQSYIFVASSKGIHYSADHGKQWQRLATDNLAFEDLTSLLVLENDMINQEDCLESSIGCLGFLAGTKKGVFFLKDGKWMPIYKGMTTNDISYLAKDAQGSVYAATEKGIFYLSLEKALPSFNKSKNVDWNNQMTSRGLFRFSHEPNISEVHALAIDYAEVNSGKIKDWRRQARRKAWLPSLDVGVDGDRNWSSSDSIWGSYSSGGQHYIGPDDKTRKEGFGWDVSLSWDLADLVWSTDQTTIDSRSKLMVELREDILNEITRLYFERRRLQAESTLSEALDPQMKFDRTMRIAELTALIDALTGGMFSERIGPEE